MAVLVTVLSGGSETQGVGGGARASCGTFDVTLVGSAAVCVRKWLGNVRLHTYTASPCPAALCVGLVFGLALPRFPLLSPPPFPLPLQFSPLGLRLNFHSIGL